MNSELCIILNNVRSAFNVGQAFRIADATGIGTLYLCGITPYPDMGLKDTRRFGIKSRADREIRKTALSGFDTVHWEYHENAQDLVRALKHQGIAIISAEITPQSVLYTTTSYPTPLAIVMGHEREGVDSEILKLSDQIVYLPMYGRGSSLNVTNSLAVLLYEIVRQNP